MRAQVLIEHVFEEYSKKSTRPAAAVPEAKVAAPNPAPSFLDEVSMVSTGDSNSEPTTAATPDLKIELERYLAGEGGICSGDDPLSWWKVQSSLMPRDMSSHEHCLQAHEGSFPIMASIARDFLAIPATSVSVERLFSAARHVADDFRSAMKAETMTETLCVRMWIKAGLFPLVPSSERPP